MADSISEAAKFRVELLVGESYLLWARRMSVVVMSKQL